MISRLMTRPTLIVTGAVAAAGVAAALFLLIGSEPASGKPQAAARNSGGVVPVQVSVSSIYGARTSAQPIDSVNEIDPALVQALTESPPGVDESLLPGTPDLSKGRVLLTDLGTSSRTIFAFPTSKGLCVGLSDFTSGCFMGFRDADMAVPMAGDPDQIGSGESFIVWGIVPDSVKAVRVTIEGEERPASVENNAFFFQAADPSKPVEAVQLNVDLSDGSSRIIKLGGFTGGIEDITTP